MDRADKKNNLNTSAILFSNSILAPNYDQVSKPLNIGLLFEALLIVDTVYIHTENFYELIHLLDYLPRNTIYNFLSSKRIKFIYDPLLIGSSKSLSSNNRNKIVFVSYGNTSISFLTGKKLSEYELLMGHIAEYPYDDYNDLGPELIEAASKQILFAPRNLNIKIKRIAANNLRDLKTVKKINTVINNHLEKDVDLLTQAEILLKNGKSSELDFTIQVSKECDEKTSKYVIYALRIICEWTKQLLLCKTFETTTILNHPFFADLSAAVSQDKFFPSTETPIATLMESIKLPDIQFLLNRDLIAVKDVANFILSKDGHKLKSFIKRVINNDIAGDNKETILKEVIASFHDKTFWEKLNNNKAFKIVKFATGQLIGGIEVLSTIFSYANFLSGETIPEGRRPTVILEESFDKKIDKESFKKELAIKFQYPALEKLLNLGYKPTCFIAQNTDKSIGVIHLDRDNGNAHFEISLGKDDHAKTYLSKFRKLLNEELNNDASLIELIGLLEIGSRIIEVRHNISNVTGEESFELVIDHNGDIRKLNLNTEESIKFIYDRYYLSNPMQTAPKLYPDSENS